MNHYLLIIIIIAIIVILQCRVFLINKEKIRIFRKIFPQDHANFLLVVDSDTNLVSAIKSTYQNRILNVIIDSINNYLSNNKGAISDFHILKDIVDRNCDAAEEEINTQIPVPLYYGLMGTMTGILIGIGFLVAGGGLQALLLVSQTPGSGTEGIQMLMGGVALAMISSIIGILLTTIGSSQAKNAKIIIEKNKNTFLSWIQAELLPNLSSDTAGTLRKLMTNLINFNQTFSSNIKELRETLGYVNETYQNQVELMKTIGKLKIKNIATANIEVYDKLKNCTEEIGQFNTYLHTVNDYIADIRILNEKLDKNESRAKFIEEMGAFFREEIQQIQNRKEAISKSVGKVDETLQNALDKLKDNTNLQFNELSRTIAKRQEEMGLKEGAIGLSISEVDKTIQEALVRLRENMELQFKELTEASIIQQRALQKKLEETSVIADELKNLTALRSSMLNLERATTEQNRKIDRLSDSIRELAEIKTVGGSVKTVLPPWLKISVILGVSILLISFLYVFIPLLIKFL
jgi:hypothetical protein